eukprot:CAMPEP_0177631040 /NCGR_PEP_ID=MMETSP0447-20121125/1536_1 /TAXON_ID=0 /ORGANISM="Stygamoeba regulata, Strain BSH-02190019" /LENGTH=49 /DNA_ID= /DNA_START= /DNA_END= /DNA_ORIENTATION=
MLNDSHHSQHQQILEDCKEKQNAWAGDDKAKKELLDKLPSPIRPYQQMW